MSPAARRAKPRAAPAQAKASTAGFTARIKIGLRKGVTDPEGNNTLKALHLLGFDSIEHVSTERIVRMNLKTQTPEEARQEAERACKRLLTNPIIHDYTIEVEGSA